MKVVSAVNFVEALLQMRSGDCLSNDKLEGYIEKQGDSYFLKYPDSIVDDEIDRIELVESRIISLFPPDQEEIVSFCQDYIPDDRAQVVELLPGEWLIVAMPNKEAFFDLDFAAATRTILFYRK